MNRRTQILVGLATVAALGLLAWAFAPRPVAVEVARVSAGPYEQAIVEDGRTRLRERYAVTAPLAGRLARITLREGDAVEAGAVVATLTPVLTPLLDERSQREQMARAEGAQAGVQRAEAGVERARVALEQARNEFKRSEQLSGQGFIGPAKLDTDRLALQAAQKELDAAVQARHIAEHERETARAALLAVRSTGAGSAAAFPVRAPIRGRVLRVQQASETTVALGTPLLELGDTAQLEVLAELLTTDALQAPPGAPVRIERWGGPGVLEGRVRRVEPAAFTKVSALGVEEQRVNVLIDLAGPPAAGSTPGALPAAAAALGDGYRVGVRILTLQQARVLKVPVSAVFPRSGGGFAVFAAEAGRARLRTVELGGRNGSDAWIKSGLAEGEEVIVYPPAEVADGVRVKARSVAVK